MAAVSVCMIVKNEEAVLARCLASVRDLVEEIVVVDTGSTDATQEIAAKWADRVAEFPWRDDFAAARNFAFDLGTMDYLMWLDADDVLEPEDRERFRVLKASLEPEEADVIFMPYRVGLDGTDRPALVYDRERLVRRSLGLRWQGAVHECITPMGKIIRWDAAVTHRKLGPGDPDRNLRIYEKLLSEGKTLSPREQFYCARELLAHGRDQEAADRLESFLAEDRGWLENNLQACLDLSGCLERLGRREDSLTALLRALRYAPPRPELCCALGLWFFRREDWNTASYWYRQALSCPAGEQGFSDPDCRGYIPLLQLCVCAYRLGDAELAASYNRRAQELKPESAACRRNQIFFSGLEKNSMEMDG